MKSKVLGKRKYILLFVKCHESEPVMGGQVADYYAAASAAFMHVLKSIFCTG